MAYRVKIRLQNIVYSVTTKNKKITALLTGLALNRCRFNFSVSSETEKALGRSCLFAKTNSTEFCSSSSFI